MRRFGETHFYFCSFLLLLNTLAGGEKQCDLDSVSVGTCEGNWRCVPKDSSSKGVCQCVIDADLVNGECVKRLSESPPTDASQVRPESKRDSGGGSVAAGLLVPTFLILLVAVGYYGARRYKWLQRIRQFRQNRYGNMLVTRDDTDDDDPPIA